VVAPPGRCLLYVDYHAEEIGVAAYLSGDANMISLYEADEDVYLGFGKMAGLLPETATVESHAGFRKKVLKPLLVGTQYGMGEEEFARKAGIPPSEARRLLRLHQTMFETFWGWASDNQERFRINGRLYTPMRDWYVRWHELAKPTTLLNWPMQAGSGDILRRAVHRLHVAGICVLTTLHDSVLVECDLAEVEDCKLTIVRCLEEASREVLGGHTIRAEVAIEVMPGGRLFADTKEGRAERAEWDRMLALLGMRPSG
jgi:DNA polymerase I-like protein with 3'-5' exonuclease and polymerase domains